MEFEAFIDQQLEDAKACPRPVKVMAEITYGCNLRCLHCYNPTHEAKGELSREKLQSLFCELAKAGTLWISLTGGEVFTRPDACELIADAQALGMVVTVITNATLVTEALADKLAALRPYQIEISLYGASAPTYEAVTRMPGSFERCVRGIERLAVRNLSLLVKPVLMTTNFHERGAMMALCEKWGVRTRVSTEIHPRVDGDMSPLAVRLSPEQMFQVWREVSGEKILAAESSQESREASGCGGAGKLFDCLCGKSGASITPYGQMNLCVSLPTPQFDLRQASIQAGWKTLVSLVAQTTPGPDYACGTCALASDCERGTMDSFLERGRLDAECLPHFRERAERRAEFLNQPKELTHG